jgi:hypothetical protein
MIRVATFMEAFPLRAGTICSEPVLAYLRATGRVAGAVPAEEQRALLARLGPMRALRLCGRRLGFRLARPETLVEGDAVLCAAPAVEGGLVCGLVGSRADVVFAAAGDGLIVTRHFRALRVARLGR